MLVDQEIKELHAAVDMFAESMKLKLEAKARSGFRGWRDLSREELYKMMCEHIAKNSKRKNQEVDIANFALFIWCKRVDSCLRI